MSYHILVGLWCGFWLALPLLLIAGFVAAFIYFAWATWKAGRP